MKRAKLTEDLQNTQLPNYSELLCRSFVRFGGFLVAHLYKLKDIQRFVILLPAELRPVPTHIVEEHKILELRPDSVETLKAFQGVLWSDLLKVGSYSGGDSETCNYLVVPAKDGGVDFETVSAALNKEVFRREPAVGDFVHSNGSQKVLWEVLQVVDITTKTEDFIAGLVGKQHPNLSDFCAKYAHSSVFDVLFDDSWFLDALGGFRNLLIKNKIASVSSDDRVLLAKQKASIRTQKQSQSKDYYPLGTPVLHPSTVVLSYLDSEAFMECLSLPQKLIDLEAFSYISDFCIKYDFMGEDYRNINSAFRSTCLDHIDNYESLETLGDTVLKFLISFYLYLDNVEETEGRMSEKRKHVVNNAFLGGLGKEQGLQYYLKSHALKFNRWKPPYFSTTELVFNDNIVHYLSLGMLADTVEAVIAAFYLAGGLNHAIDVIQKLRILGADADWSKVRKYCDSYRFDLLSPAKLLEWQVPSKLPLATLIPPPNALLPVGSLSDKLYLMLKSFNYVQESGSRVFIEAFTHKSCGETFDYERLEFLGDALIDLIVISNLWAAIDEPVPPHTMTLMHHALVNNNILAFYCISLNLQSYFLADRSITDALNVFLAELRWEDDLLNFGVHNHDPPKPFSDIIESFAAALLIDSGSVAHASKIMQLVMAKPMAYFAINKSNCQANIKNRAIELVQKQGHMLKFKCFKGEDDYTATAYISGHEKCSSTASTSWLAESLAANKVYNMMLAESL
mmetsp:Transcript_6525/g.11419  ORF Transcript_6525/g.11419 Transcript_6525/m.11419 type:complete len:737 (-) Transcript_6525:572-2782(-)|eukprot:CAMPEP_0204912472 /NCGR_PEP_ID=MMETSP1397-20131031/10613_1 /ASSEMBLY_ACC=CAM_ASM_000891 /TAXON_ID=49980 /ORGANISM="Climacostomum Climacostomum virens, Strain Stock W-24" /LENGTH=736 /DNA_ID=CAMNT_0052083433 /DNA_START=916 /DNA_END=3126 /DNA_ORIENTATION=-